jgi:hypothetical protein
MRAFNAGDVGLSLPLSSDWRKQLSDLPMEGGTLEISPALLIAGLVCMVLCTLVWKRASKPAKIPDAPAQVGWQGPA